MNCYRRFQTHKFDVHMPEELETYLFTRADADVAQLINQTWNMDKPVSLIHVGTDIGKGEKELLDRYFHTYEEDVDLDGVKSFLYFSRFPEFPEIVANGSSAIEGILFGYDVRDVASFVEMKDGSISPQ